jgi:hypothetical protein
VSQFCVKNEIVLHVKEKKKLIILSPETRKKWQALWQQ